MSESRSRRKRAGQAGKDVVLTEEARRVMLLIAAPAVDDEMLSGCPATVLQEQAASCQAGLCLQMESWCQLGDLLSWFVKAALAVDPQARLRFAACLPKECRADVHKLVQRKINKICESTSDGFGDERHVVITAKGAGGKQKSSAEQVDHALALWYLYKHQLKSQYKRHGQHQLELEQQGQERSQQQAAQGCVDMHAAAVPTGRQYSRDEVAQMLVQGKLTEELCAVWHSPVGEAQRQTRLLCLAASAGELQDLKDLIAANPQLVPGSVLDLCSGGQLPLHLAAAAGEVEALRILLDAGADVKAINGNGETALQVAQRCEQCDCEAVLLQADSVNTQQDNWLHFNGESP